MSSFHLIKLFDYAFLVVISSDLTFCSCCLIFYCFSTIDSTTLFKFRHGYSAN